MIAKLLIDCAMHNGPERRIPTSAEKLLPMVPKFFRQQGVRPNISCESRISCILCLTPEEENSQVLWIDQLDGVRTEHAVRESVT